MTNRVSTPSLDGLITALLSGRPYNQRALLEQSRRYVRRLIAGHAGDLADDLAEDVVQQAFVELLKDGSARHASDSGVALFRAAVKVSIRTVRANHIEPGQRTRASSKPGRERVAAEDIGKIADRRIIEFCITGEGASRALDFDRLPSAAAAARHSEAEARLAVDTVLKRAPGIVGDALRLIHLDEEPVAQVARRLRVSRFVLNRRIESFCATWRGAA